MFVLDGAPARAWLPYELIRVSFRRKRKRGSAREIGSVRSSTNKSADTHGRTDRDALTRFDEYQLAKYRRDHGTFKLVDAVNLVRPKATPPLTKLVRGELAPAQTWETKLTQAGEANTAELAAAAKSEAWAQLVRERKLGYLALLRNLRNVLTHAPEVVDELCKQLVNEEAVRRSLVFPFQFLSAIEVLEQGNLAGADRVMAALNDAIDLSLAHVPKFEGRTLVALDSSGSMIGRPQAIGSLFAACS